MGFNSQHLLAPTRELFGGLADKADVDVVVGVVPGWSGRRLRTLPAPRFRSTGRSPALKRPVEVCSRNARPACRGPELGFVDHSATVFDRTPRDHTCTLRFSMISSPVAPSCPGAYDLNRVRLVAAAAPCMAEPLVGGRVPGARPIAWHTGHTVSWFGRDHHPGPSALRSCSTAAAVQAGAHDRAPPVPTSCPNVDLFTAKHDSVQRESTNLAVPAPVNSAAIRASIAPWAAEHPGQAVAQRQRPPLLLPSPGTF